MILQHRYAVCCGVPEIETVPTPTLPIPVLNPICQIMDLSLLTPAKITHIQSLISQMQHQSQLTTSQLADSQLN
jgi:hypothetical protein